MKEQYFVLRKDTHPGDKVPSSYALAEDQPYNSRYGAAGADRAAERLAEKHPGQEFLVVASRASVKTGVVVTTVNDIDTVKTLSWGK